LPISEFIDIKNIFEDPWAELQHKDINYKYWNINKHIKTENSIEFIINTDLPNFLSESI
jgi:ppGpp synthetase/RelA/SpoT-type nucleotidyltranferase